MTRWKITGILATLIIILSVPVYLMKEKYITSLEGTNGIRPAVEFVGDERCKDCHKREYDLWKGSHHAQAMDVATEKTVLGDFNNASFEHFGVVSRFYRKDGKFFVHTQGPEGKMGDFEITHTFGVFPLQQYLAPFPGGRLQCLLIAWDVKQKRWYHLYPDAPIDPNDWLYWTHAAQSWNGMCAECHTTNLKKNYDPDSDTYHTTWSSIHVGCEACHGPGLRHVSWAELPPMARPLSDNYELGVSTARMTSRRQVELCAPCHSRRMSLGDNTHGIPDFLDYGVPQLLHEGMYFPDGQIIEEVYEYGSFLQSKMYNRDVRCRDCHDVHSIKRIKEGNDLCLQCHRADIYNTKEHHFHKMKGEKGDPIRAADGAILFDVGTGSQCELCHMPGRYYMGIDYRLDHSLRVPRPDLSDTLGAPNACNRCHQDKTNQWSAEYIRKWYGSKYKPHYGTILDAGRKALPEAKTELIRLADNRLFPTIVRATALSLLTSFSGDDVDQAYERSLNDEEALMRHTAINQMETLPVEKRIRLMIPLLYDPVKSVRIEAARNLIAVPKGQLNMEEEKKYQEVRVEFQQAMEYTADFAPSRHNLGNMYAGMGDNQKAVDNYQAAIQIDDQFFPAKVNLAMLYNQLGNNDEAERLLREVVQKHPKMHDIEYSLGLLLGERQKYDEASFYLSSAARGLPNHARAHYNLGLILDYLGKDLDAEAALRRALALEPKSMDYLNALAQYYLKRKRYKEAERMAEKMIGIDSANERAGRILGLIKQERSKGNDP
jgi:tetratricopeptide (TPR) repeat protein